MSEYTPITTDLRLAMANGNFHFDGHHIVREELTIARERFYELCDAIDAVHRGLEQENDRLRRELMDKALCERTNGGDAE